eukprot:6078755-Amphidinium_carterae.1
MHVASLGVSPCEITSLCCLVKSRPWKLRMLVFSFNFRALACPEVRDNVYFNWLIALGISLLRLKVLSSSSDACAQLLRWKVGLWIKYQRITTSRRMLLCSSRNQMLTSIGKLLVSGESLEEGKQSARFFLKSYPIDGLVPLAPWMLRWCQDSCMELAYMNFWEASSMLAFRGSVIAI